jgi:O-acetyl-ADP-ribose deacetylase (regulator of RNase III)
MLYEVRGDLLAASPIVIAHGCNCRGVMGAGIARQIREAYPAVYEHYRRACREGSFRPGTCQLVWVEPGRAVANLASQDGYGRTGVHANPFWIGEAVRELKERLRRERLGEFAISRIGCSLGGLDWARDVRPLLVGAARDIDIYVYSR